MPRRCAASAGGMRDRGSLASLPAPAPLAHPPGAGIPAIMAPLRARETMRHHDGASRLGGYQHCSRENHARLNQHRNVVTDRNGLRAGCLVRRDPCSRRVRQPGRSGTRTRRLPGSRKRSTSWPAPSPRTARNSPTNAKACSGVSSMHCTPRSSGSTAASTRSRPR